MSTISELFLVRRGFLSTIKSEFSAGIDVDQFPRSRLAYFLSGIIQKSAPFAAVDVKSGTKGLTCGCRLSKKQPYELEHMMDFEAFFKSELDGLHTEGRYRVFADLERHRGNFPRATRHTANGEQEVTV
ncbi:MAG: hypothetical protein AAAB19_13205, partial [Rhizobium sp.]